MEEGNKYHYLVATLLGVAGLMIILIFVVVRSQADDVTTSVGVNNSAPVINSINLGSASTSTFYNNADFELTPNITTDIHVNGSLTDNNGCSEIDSTSQLEVTFYKDGTSCNPANHPSGDGTNCYYVTGSSCTISNCDGDADTTEDFDCTVPVQHYADYADWYATVLITDDSNATDQGTSSAVAQVQPLTSMHLTSASIDWGSLDLSASSTDVPIGIENYGNNNAMDINLNASNLSCSTGTIDVSAVKYATGTVTYANKAAMSSTPVLFPLHQTKGTDANPTPGTDVQFQIQLPATGLAGTCSGTILIST